MIPTQIRVGRYLYLYPRKTLQYSIAIALGVAVAGFNMPLGVCLAVTIASIKLTITWERDTEQEMMDRRKF